MKTRLIPFLLLCLSLFCNSDLWAQAHTSYVTYKNGKHPAISIKINAPANLAKVVLEERLKSSGLKEKGKTDAGFKVYNHVIFTPFAKDFISLYSIVESLSGEENGCVVSLLVKKSATDTFVDEKTDGSIINNVKTYLTDLEKIVEKTFLEHQITEQTKQLEKAKKQLIALEKDSAYITEQLLDFNKQAKESAQSLVEKREELRTQQMILNELSSKRKK